MCDSQRTDPWQAELAELREKGAFQWTLEWGSGARTYLLGRRDHLFSLYASDGVALHFDLEGRLRRAFFPEVGERGSHFLRGLDGSVLRRSRVAPAANRESPASSHQVFARAHSVILEALESLSRSEGSSADRKGACLELLERAAAYDPAHLENEKARFLEAYRPLGVLPPDRYRSLILQVTEGCSYNACTFCELYRGQRFRVKSPGEMQGHIHRVKAFLGDALFLRRGVFLGEANALLAPQAILLEALDLVRAEIPGEVVGPDGDPSEPRDPDSLRGAGGISSFLDAFTGHRKAPQEFTALRQRGLRRVFLGVESGDEEILKCVRKPESCETVREVVDTVKAAGISVGIVLLVGVGGERFRERHLGRTFELLGTLPLDAGDVIYLSALVTRPGGAYERWAAAQGIRPLGPAELLDQERELRRRLRSCRGTSQTRVAPYNLQGFLYY